MFVVDEDVYVEIPAFQLLSVEDTAVTVRGEMLVQLTTVASTTDLEPAMSTMMNPTPVSPT